MLGLKELSDYFSNNGFKINTKTNNHDTMLSGSMPGCMQFRVKNNKLEFSVDEDFMVDYYFDMPDNVELLKPLVSKITKEVFSKKHFADCRPYNINIDKKIIWVHLALKNRYLNYIKKDKVKATKDKIKTLRNNMNANFISSNDDDTATLKILEDI